jgi:AcrR family transcriptional regulator
MPTGTATRRRGPTKGDRREQAILAAATELFGKKPIGQITIDELAAAAGLSRSSFYFYFGSKHAVLAALVESIADDLAAGHNAWLDGTGCDEDAIREATSRLAALWRTHGALIEQARAAGNEYRPVVEFLDGAADRFAARLAAKIIRDRQAGVAPPGIAPDVLARMVDAVRSARLRTLIGRRDSRADARVVEDVVELTKRLLYGKVSCEQGGQG